MTSITTPQSTPGLFAESVVMTSGSTSTINAPAAKVFDIITNASNYETWNTWTPKFVFSDGIKKDAEGELTAMMDTTPYKIPVKILECSSNESEHFLAWRASLMPSWFATAERVHFVKSIDAKSCEVRQWESMSGWGVYLLKWFLGTHKQLEKTNLQYIKELKAYAEKQSSASDLRG